MSAFVHSLKADLLDRRLLPILALAGALLLAAVAYAALGGSSSSSGGPARGGAVPTPAGIAVTESRGNPAAAVAETTTGTPVQRQGVSHDPFNLLPSALTNAVTKTSATTATTTPTTGAAPEKASSGGSSSSPGSTPAPAVTKAEPKATQPGKPTTEVRYSASALFGVVPSAEPGAPATPLKSYALKVHEPLPAHNPLLIYMGVVARTGKLAVFGLTGEAIIHGSASCVPSPTLCQAIELAPGQAETFQTFDSSGNVVNYKLELVSITNTVASAASVASVSARTAQLARETLQSAGVWNSLGLSLAH